MIPQILIWETKKAVLHGMIASYASNKKHTEQEIKCEAKNDRTINLFATNQFEKAL